QAPAEVLLKNLSDAFIDHSIRALQERTLPVEKIYAMLARMRRHATVTSRRPEVSPLEEDILRAVSRFDPATEVTAAEIAAKAFLSRDGTSASCQALLRKGFLIRELRKRVGYYRLSPTGQEIVARLPPPPTVARGALLPRPLIVPARARARPRE
ncbi:MAG: MarR family transcriptional regulator, partial [Gemmatimonas sp.]